MRHPSDLHAFALGDLTGDAEAAVAQHVATCRRCRREVRRLRADHAAAVDALEPVAPSAAGRARALETARAFVPAAATADAEPAPLPAAAKPRARPRVRLGWALAWVVAAAAAGLSWERHTAWRASDGDRAIVAAWLTRDDVTTWPLAASDGARSPGTVMVADDGVVLVVMRAEAPAGRAYRTWGVGADGATALGDVPRTVLRATAAGFEQVVVSLEPRRATSAPTELLGAAPITAAD